MNILLENSPKAFALRSFLSAALSLVLSFLYLVYNLLLGVFYHAPWNFSISFYYLSLVALRGYILFSEKRWRQVTPPVRKKNRQKLFRRICCLLFLVDFLLIVPIALMVLSQRPVGVGKITAIALAAYTTYRVIMSIIRFRKSSRSENLSLFSLKIIDMADTLVSVLTLQNTMVTVFGSGESMLELIAYTSGATFLALLVFTAVLIRKGTPGKKEP